MTAPDSESQPLAGTFWQIDTPERSVRGELTIEESDEPHLEVTGRLFDERAWVIRHSPSGGTTMSHSGNSEDLVADWQARHIHGRLDDGRAVSLVETHGGRVHDWWPIPYRQQFKAGYAVIEELVDGDIQTYAAIRFRLGRPHRWAPAEIEATCDAGRLRMFQRRRRSRFRIHARGPNDVRRAGSRVINPITTLTELVSRNSAAETGIHVRVSAESPWRRLHRELHNAQRRGQPLMDAAEVTADQFAAWIDFRAVTDGLDAGALDTLEGIAIQTQVLAQAAIAEGLCRRIFSEKRRFPSLRPGDLRRERRAAREAAMGTLSGIDDEEFRAAFNEGFGGFNKQPFESRMRDLVEEAQAMIPGIVANFADWPLA